MDSSFQNHCIIRWILYGFLDINLIILFYLFPNYKLYPTNKLQATKTLISMTENVIRPQRNKVYIKIHVHPKYILILYFRFSFLFISFKLNDIYRTIFPLSFQN